MAIPVLEVLFDFSNGPVFGYSFELGSPDYGILGTGTLGLAPSDIVDISNQVTKVNIRRGYDLLQDQFQAGTATVRVYDPNGDWSPENPASPYFGKLVPLRKMRIAADGIFLFSGYTIAYNYSYPKDQEIGFVDIELVDAYRLFANANITSISGGTVGQTTGQRINKILDAVGWPTSMRDIDTGATTVLADPGTARTSLNAILNVTFCEQGAFYFDPAGKATFQDRAFIQSKTGADPTDFANDGTGIPYFNVKFAFDDKLIINQCSLTRTGGTLQFYQDLPSIEKYFPHSLSFTDMMFETDAQALTIATLYVDTRAETTIRIDALTLDLLIDNAAATEAALTLDFFDTIYIKNVAQDGTIIEKTLQCMGVTHDISPSNWFTTFTTSEPIA